MSESKKTPVVGTYIKLSEEGIELLNELRVQTGLTSGELVEIMIARQHLELRLPFRRAQRFLFHLLVRNISLVESEELRKALPQHRRPRGRPRNEPKPPA
jgi:hypothetical protein